VRGSRRQAVYGAERLRLITFTPDSNPLPAPWSHLYGSWKSSGGVAVFAGEDGFGRSRSIYDVKSPDQDVTFRVTRPTIETGSISGWAIMRCAPDFSQFIQIYIGKTGDIGFGVCTDVNGTTSGSAGASGVLPAGTHDLRVVIWGQTLQYSVDGAPLTPLTISSGNLLTSPTNTFIGLQQINGSDISFTNIRIAGDF